MTCERVCAVKLMICLTFLSLLFGCIQLPKHDEPAPAEMDRCEPRLPAKSLEPASLTVSFSRMGVEQNIMVRNEQAAIRNRLMCSGLFKDIVHGKSLQGYYLEVSILNEPMSPPYYGRYAWLSLATATLIPGYDEERFRLVMNIYYDGIYRGQVEAVRSIEVWYWLPFMLVIPPHHGAVRREVYDNLAGDANEKLRQSGIISKAVSAK